MTTLDMIELVGQRTKVRDESKILIELAAAYAWAVNEVYKSADGPQLLCTVGEEIAALAAVTRDYDLESNLTGGSLLGITQLWVKLTDDVNFTPINPRSLTHPDFISMDATPTATPLVASGFPIFYAVTNFGQVRFAPALPIGAIIRADYSRFGPPLDLASNPTPENGTDLPSLFHHSIVNKTVAHLFNTLDDSREGSWETRAMTTLNSAIYAAGKGTRTQRPVETTPFRRGNRRRGI